MSDNDYDIVIFEDDRFPNLLPLVYYRAVFDLRCGSRTLRQRISANYPNSSPTLFLRDELARVSALDDTAVVKSQLDQPRRTLFINGRSLLTSTINPDPNTQTLIGLKDSQIAYIWADPDLAANLTSEIFRDPDRLSYILEPFPKTKTHITLINYPWDLVHHNESALIHDWHLINDPQIQGHLYPGVHLLAKENISIGPGTTIKPSTVLDAENGPIIIGQNVTIKPNCTLEGPLFIGDNSLIQPGSVISETVSIGPVCKVGGELESSIIHSHSNKQHDGFLGHSYIGSWVNLAADTINSDLKNTYGPVRVPINGREVDSGHMFVGLTMGDFSKTSVNTMFSTGSVVGFGCSIFNSGFVPRFVPSFSWLTDQGRSAAILEKVIEIAEKVMARRKVSLSDAERQLFQAIHRQSQEYEYCSVV